MGSKKRSSLEIGNESKLSNLKALDIYANLHYKIVNFSEIFVCIFKILYLRELQTITDDGYNLIYV